MCGGECEGESEREIQRVEYTSAVEAKYSMTDSRSRSYAERTSTCSIQSTSFSRTDIALRTFAVVTSSELL